MQEEITLTVAGAIPGLPDLYGAGTYLVDWETRTAASVTPQVSQPLAAEEPTQPENEPSGEEEAV